MRHYPAVPARGLRRFNRRYGERTFHNFAVAAVWILVFAFLFAWHYWQEVVGAGFCILGVHLLRRIAKRGALRREEPMPSPVYSSANTERSRRPRLPARLKRP